MEVIGQPGMSADHQVSEKAVVGRYDTMSSEIQSGIIHLPKIRGGIVTRMTVFPVSGVIAEMNVETSESSISFPEEVRFDLNARINIQRIVIVGGSGMDHQ